MIATGTAALIAGLVSAGASAATGAYGAKKQSQATSKAADISAASNAAALAEQKRLNDIQKQEFDTQQAQLKAQWEAEQNLRAPYRAAGQSALSSLGDILGVSFGEGGGGGAPAGPSASAGPTGALPARPADLNAAMKVANDTAYGFEKHTDPTYWQALWQKDPEYAFRRMLGEQAGPQDAAKTGPYAGAGAASSASSQRRAPLPLAPQIVAPAGRNALDPNYAPVVPFSQFMGQ